MRSFIRQKLLRLAELTLHDGKPPVLYFLHIPKTAGTTVDYMLRTRFAANQANQTHDVIQLMRTPESELRQFDYISGHLEFGYYLSKLMRRRIRPVVFVREPRSLFLSLYNQVSYENDPMHEHFTKNCSTMEAFFYDPVISEYIANFQTRYLAIAERRFDPKTVARVRTAEPSKIRTIAAVPDGTAAQQVKNQPFSNSASTIGPTPH